MSIIEDIQKLNQFSGNSLSNTVSSLEKLFLGISGPNIKRKLNEIYIDEHLISASFAVKKVSAQIDVIIHASSILYCLPSILDDDEQVIGLSLGAGAAQGDFDLETSKRIAEFKFIRWQRTGNAVRKKSLFQDYVKLALSNLDKDKFIYLLDSSNAISFLSGKSNPYRLLDRNRRLYEAFQDKFINHYKYVGEFYDHFSSDIKIVDLFEIIPNFKQIIS